MKKLLCILLLIFFTCCSTLKDPSFIEILKSAQHYIKVDSIKYFTVGMPFLIPVFAKSTLDTIIAKNLKFFDSIIVIHQRILNKQKLIESIHKKYGLYSKNLGCVINKQTNVLSKKYKKETQTYLEKRNGVGWEEKLKKEINEIE